MPVFLIPPTACAPPKIVYSGCAVGNREICPQPYPARFCSWKIMRLSRPLFKHQQFISLAPAVVKREFWRHWRVKVCAVDVCGFTQFKNVGVGSIAGLEIGRYPDFWVFFFYQLVTPSCPVGINTGLEPGILQCQAWVRHWNANWQRHLIKAGEGKRPKMGSPASI